jgi:hypothetical protein
MSNQKTSIQPAKFYAAAKKLSKSESESLSFPKKCYLMELSDLHNSKANNIHLLVLTTGSLANPNILSHCDAIMRAEDNKKFFLAMEEEIDR